MLLTPRSPSLLRTAILLGFPLVLGACLVFMAFANGLVILTPPLFGYDWLWYRDGMERVLSGLPLYDPALLAGSYNQLTPEFNFTWQQAPNTLVAVAPYYLLPAELRQVVFGSISLVAAIVALWLVLPRSWPPVPRTALALAVVLNPIAASALWLGNMNTLVALGLALVWVGRARGSNALVTVGLVLSGLKVIPAVLLGAWLVVHDRAWRPVLVAFTLSVLAALPALAIYGIDTLAEFVVVQINADLVTFIGNVGPAAFAARAGIELPSLVTLLPALVLISAALVPRFLAPATSLLALMVGMCLLVQLLWVHWLFIPLIAVLIWTAESPRARSAALRLERWRIS